MNFKVGDEVVVITGSDKGKTGKILKVLRAENKVWHLVLSLHGK